MKKIRDGKMWGGGKTALAFAIAVSFINGMTFGTLAANHQWASSGNVAYSKDGASTISFNRDDLDYLDLRIDQVENDVTQAKTDLATEINNWSLPADRVLSSASSFSDINNALLYLRSVPNNGEICTDDSGSQVYLKESGGLTLSADDAVSTDPVRYTKATADNLSAGTVAWSEGQLIVGNGADNESYYSQGKANATVNKVLIGRHTASINTTSCSFNCTSIPGWSNLTSENFSFIPTGGYMNFQSRDEIRSHSDRSGNVSISYNNSTGVVTVSGLQFGLQTYTEVYSWVCLSGNVYCYIVTD